MKKILSKLSRKMTSFLAILLCALMVLTVFPANISYAANDDVYTNEIIEYEYNGCKGYYFTPIKAGKYDTVVMIHGGTSVSSMKNNLTTLMNTWVKAGYFDPMVVVIPVIEDFGFGDGRNGDNAYFKFLQNHLKYIDNDDKFGTLLQKIESGELSPQIDTEGDILVGGFSMGGMSALLAGAVHSTRVKKVGALSPGAAFIREQGGHSDGYFGNMPDGMYDIYYSKDPDAFVFLSAGVNEGADITGPTYRYYEAITKSGNNRNGLLKYNEAPASWGGHGWGVAQKEIFMFLYRHQYGVYPSNDLVETACNGITSYPTPEVLAEDTAHPASPVTIKPYEGDALVDLDVSTYVKDTTTSASGSSSIGNVSNNGTLAESTTVKMSSQTSGPASLDLSKETFVNANGTTTSYLNRTINSQTCKTNNTFNTIENAALETQANTISFWAKYVPVNASSKYNLFDYYVSYSGESKHLFTLDQNATTNSSFVLGGRVNRPPVIGKLTGSFNSSGTFVSDPDTYTDITDATAGKWAHYVITNPEYSSNDRKVMKIYINGEYVYSRMVVKPSGDAINAKIAFGGDAISNDNVYWPTDLSLGDVTIYDGELTANEVMSEYTISKGKYTVNNSGLPNITGYTLSDSVVEYDEENHMVAVDVAGDATPGTTVTYTCNGEPFTGATEIGTYYVTATVSKAGYNDLVLGATFKIKGAEIKGYTLSDSVVEYDGENHTLAVSTAADATQGTTVTYTCDGKPFTGAKDIGTYDVTATVSKAGYTDLVLNAKLEITEPQLKLNVEFDSESKIFNVSTSKALLGVNRVLLIVKDSKDTVVYMDAMNAVAEDSVSFEVDLGKKLRKEEFTFVVSSMGDTITAGTKTCESDASYDSSGDPLEITGYTFSNSTVEYDGENHTLAVSAAADATSGTTITYTCNGEPFTGATDVGTYNVTATISKAGYYDLVLNAKLVIEAGNIKGYTFSDSAVDYDGQNHMIDVLAGTDATPDTTVSYTCNGEAFTGATEVGIYDITATISKVGYNDIVLNAKLEIKGANITGYTFSDSTVVYDGENHMLTVSVAADATPDTTITYTCNGEPFTGATAIGIYNVTATISKAGYHDLVLNAKLKIKVANDPNDDVVFDEATFFDVEYDEATGSFIVKGEILKDDTTPAVNRLLLMVYGPESDGNTDPYYMDALNSHKGEFEFSVPLSSIAINGEYKFVVFSYGDVITNGSKKYEYGSNFETYGSIAPGSTIGCVYTLEENESAPTVIIAVYKGDVLVRVVTSNEVNDGKVTAEIQFVAGEDTTGYSARAFVWKDATNLKPLMGARVFK